MPGPRLRAKSITFPVVGPGGSWNGTALSGGTPPVDPTRTTAKPAAQWWQPSEVRASANVTIGVDADALGGIDYVDFWVEGTTQRVWQQNLYRDNDVNGLSRKRLGYWITLNNAAFTAVSTTGTVSIFATVQPTDSTMQARVIGYVRVNVGASSGNNGDRVMTFFPRPVGANTLANDFGADFFAQIGSGKPYATLTDARAAAVTAGAEAALFELTDSTNYELPHLTSGAVYTGAKGFHVIRAASGVSATVRREVFPGADEANYLINPRMEHLEFRGSGLTVDWLNFTTMGDFGTWARCCRWNGCVITNSQGRDSLYWNKGQVVGGRQVPCRPSYFEDCTIDNCTWLLTNAFLVTGNKCHTMGGHLFTGTTFVANNYVSGLDSGYFRVAVSAMTLSYTGGGAGTADKTGSSDGGSLVLKVDAVAVATYVLGYNSTDTWYEIEDIVDDINANTGTTGFSATFIDGSRRATALLGDGFGSSNGFTGRVINGTPTPLDTWFDQHSDLYQCYTDGSNLGKRENVILRGNTARLIAAEYPSNSGTLTFLFDAPVQDFLILDSVFSGTAGTNSVPPSRAHSHFWIRNVILEAATSLQAATGDTYCRWEQCWLGEIGWAVASGATPFIFKDSLINVGFQDGGAGTAFDTATNTGNSRHRPAVVLSTYTTSASTGDYRPSGSMATKAKLSVYDGLLNARAATDAIGAVALGQGAPSWPF